MIKAETNANKYLHICLELNAQYEAYARSFGISYSTLSALRTVLEHDGDCTQRAICKYTLLPKQTVSAIVIVLLCRGAIRVVELDSDRRHKVIRLIDKGQVSALGVIQKMKNAESRVMEGLDGNQKETMLMTTELYVACSRGYLLE